jgi:hypothetical protein
LLKQTKIMSWLRQITVSKQARAWLLCFALLFPIAQTLALTHAVSSHDIYKTCYDITQKSVHSTSCNLCPMAHTVLGGAAIASAPVFQVFVSPFSTPPISQQSADYCRLVRPYQSQAPPAALN